jgi:hypothetical protein
MTPDQLAEKIRQTRPIELVSTKPGVSTRRWIVEGDIGLTERDLIPYATERIAIAERAAADPEIRSFGLMAMESEGKIVRWERGLVLDYCVWKPSFVDDAEYEAVVRDMAFATADWSAICGVRFRHAAQHDTDEQLQRGDVLFPVIRHPGGGNTVAMAFFPTSPPEERTVWVFDGHFAREPAFAPVGVLRHELGHVLGFRHEHIAPEAPDLFEPESLEHIIRLTPYNPTSVMHYVMGSVGDPRLQFTDHDRSGAVRVYGAPDSDFDFKH